LTVSGVDWGGSLSAQLLFNLHRLEAGAKEKTLMKKRTRRKWGENGERMGRKWGENGGSGREHDKEATRGRREPKQKWWHPPTRETSRKAPSQKSPSKRPNI